MKMSRLVDGNTGRHPTAMELAEAKRIAALDKGRLEGIHPGKPDRSL
jgi:hypothetical protein